MLVYKEARLVSQDPLIICHSAFIRGQDWDDLAPMLTYVVGQVTKAPQDTLGVIVSLCQKGGPSYYTPTGDGDVLLVCEALGPLRPCPRSIMSFSTQIWRKPYHSFYSHDPRFLDEATQTDSWSVKAVRTLGIARFL
jgi:hypothetical protein